MDFPRVLKPVPGYGIKYWCSNNGQVFSMVKGCLELNLFDDHKRTGPRLTVQLYNLEKKRRTWCVHTLVATTFELTKRPGDYLVRHLDGNYKNNNVSNLAWGTDLENAADRKLHAAVEDDYSWV